MSTSMLLGMFDWIGDFFKALFDLIPKIMYLLYSSLASVLDLLQLFFRKLAGLDVYYVDGKAVSGDIVTNFIAGILGWEVNATDGVKFQYSALTTVFYSFLCFGVIMVFITTMVAIIKSHYSYDEKSAKGPMQYVYTAGKAIINMLATPVIVILGLVLSQAILTALDNMTSTTSGSIEALYGDKADLLQEISTSKSATGLSSEKTYIYYDIFGFGGAITYGTNTDLQWLDQDIKNISLIGASNSTFSGAMFRVAAYNGNRARTGQLKYSKGGFTGASSSDLELFANAQSQEQLADMIDTAFANHLHTKEPFKLDYSNSNNGIVSLTYFTNFLTRGSQAFSKFNVGLVWYYYDLWQFNFVVGFASCIVCATLFINIIFGLMSRLFMCVGLFLIAPPLFGLAPLDGGNAGKDWRKKFMGQVLMAYGAVVGMNIFFLILPYINEIDFFNIGIADLFARTLFIIVGLITIKAFIAVVSGLIGAEDANKTGEGMKDEVGKVAGKATAMTVGAAKGVIGAPKNIVKGAKAVANKVEAHKLGKQEKKAQKGLDNMEEYDRQKDALTALNGKNTADVNKDDFIADYIANGGTEKEAKSLWKTVESEKARGGTFNRHNLMTTHASNDKKFSAAMSRYSGAMGGRNRRDDRTRFERERRTASTLKGVADQKYERNKSGLIGMKDLVLSPLKNLDSVMGENPNYSAFLEKSGIRPKTDWTKVGAQATQDLLKETRGGREDLRTGFGSINTNVARGFNNTSRKLGNIDSHMTTGFADTGTKIDTASAQAHADADINRAREELNTKRARLEEEVRRAQRRLAEAERLGASARSLAGYRAQITRMDNQLKSVLADIRRQGF